MICVACTQSTANTPCTHCGAEPRLDGRYTLLSQIGQGSTGTTYRAQNPEGTNVAIKESVLRNAEADKVKELVVREARVLRQLSHPQVPAYIEELWVPQGRTISLFLVQELIPGTDLSDLLMDHRYTEEEVLAVLLDLCDVLSYLHGCSPPIVHRDLKPSNIIRRPNGRHVLVDYGSVRDVLKSADIGGSTVAGTFGYMAPEQFAGDASPSSDLYALGALAVALLTRKDPASLQAPDRTVDWHAHANVSPGAQSLIDALLALEPDARPSSAHELSALLQRLIDGDARNDESLQGFQTLTGHAPRPESHPSLKTLPSPYANRPESDGPIDFDQHMIPHRAAPGLVPEARPSGTVVWVAMASVLALFLAGMGAALLIIALSAPAPEASTWSANNLPWPSMSAPDLASLPVEPTCMLDVSAEPDVTGETVCAEPLRNVAEQQVRHNFVNNGRMVLLAVTWAPRPPSEYLVEVDSKHTFRPGAPFYTPPEDDGAQPIDWIRPTYPIDATTWPLANMSCDLLVDVAMDGLPDAVHVSGCPLPFHGPSIETVGRLRWEPTSAPQQVRFGYAYSKP